MQDEAAHAPVAKISERREKEREEGVLRDLIVRCASAHHSSEHEQH